MTRRGPLFHSLLLESDSVKLQRSGFFLHALLLKSDCVELRVVLWWEWFVIGLDFYFEGLKGSSF